MIKIGIDCSDKLKLLLSETLDYNFVDSGDEVKVFLIDVETDNFYEKLKLLTLKNIFVIALVGEKNINDMRKIYNLKLADDCILRHEILTIEKSIENFLVYKKKKDKLYLNDNFQKAVVEIDEITHITFSRLSRKTQFNLADNFIFNIKKNFSDVEESLRDFPEFYKLDRSTIVNLNLVKFLDFREEYIIFKNSSKLYISKSKLKELEDKILSNNTSFQI